MSPTIESRLSQHPVLDLEEELSHPVAHLRGADVVLHPVLVRPAYGAERARVRGLQGRRGQGQASAVEPRLEGEGELLDGLLLEVPAELADCAKLFTEVPPQLFSDLIVKLPFLFCHLHSRNAV